MEVDELGVAIEVDAALARERVTGVCTRPG
jgi:hypothetical protein